MPRISAQRQQDRYDAILDAAQSVFADCGYEAASISQIARLAGVSDGLIYRYFDNKRDLLIQVLARFYERIIAEMDRALAAKTGFAQRLATLVTQHLNLFVSDRELCRLVLTEVRTAGDYRGSRIHELNRRYTSVLLRLTAEGVAEGVVRPDVDARILRDLLFGGVEHLVWRSLSEREPVDIPRISAALTSIIQGGVMRIAA